jgi:uncharacterized protein YyaL (SSP411 family)
MKTIKLLSAIFGLFIITASFKPAEKTSLNWMNFNEGYTLAKKKNKIMLIDVYTDWCGWCKRMDRDTYEKEEIMAALNKDFVVIKFNPEIPDAVYKYEGKEYNGQQLAGVISNYQLTGYPTTVFIQPKTKKQNVVSGYYDANRFKGLLETIVAEFSSKKSKKS